MLPIGAPAPSFSVPRSDGSSEELQQILMRGPLILFFYPADFSMLCTREVCLFRDQYEQLQGLGVEVVGVSPQSTKTHNSFSERHQLPYALIADRERALINAYDVAGPFGFVRRVTYLIDEDQRIQYRTLADLRLRPHQELVDRALQLKELRQTVAPLPNLG